MSENGLPCLDLLEATPEILRGLMAELSDEDVRWKPAPDRFSVGEVLAHLSHSESHCYRARLDRFMAEEQPEFEPGDAQFHVERYRNADPEDEFDHFEEQRQSNVEFLRDLLLPLSLASTVVGGDAGLDACILMRGNVGVDD